MELAPTSNLRALLNDLQREQALTMLPVLPLDENQIGSLVAHLPEHIVQSIQSQAGGNPFFAEELARVSDSGVSVLSADGEDIARRVQDAAIEKESLAAPSAASRAPAMPDTIKVMLDRRLSRLSNDCQTFLGKVAVLGGSFEFNQVASMVGDQGTNEDAILDLLEEALRAGLLTEEGAGIYITYHFWHPLIVSHLLRTFVSGQTSALAPSCGQYVDAGLPGQRGRGRSRHHSSPEQGRQRSHTGRPLC
jgi:predicted ATPase